MPPTALDEKQHADLRTDIQTMEVEGRRLDSVAVIAIGALWTWAIKDADANLYAIGVIGALIAAAAGAKAWALSHLIMAKGAYIAKIEKRYTDDGGFEVWFANRRPKSLTRVPVAIFVTLLVVSLVAPSFVKRAEPAPRDVTVHMK